MRKPKNDGLFLLVGLAWLFLRLICTFNPWQARSLYSGSAMLQISLAH